MLRTFLLPSGAALKIEVEDRDGGGGYMQTGILDHLDLAKTLQPLAELCSLALDQIQASAAKANKIEIALGVKLGLEGNIIIGKGTSEANLSVTLTFDKAV